MRGKVKSVYCGINSPAARSQKEDSSVQPDSWELVQRRLHIQTPVLPAVSVGRAVSGGTGSLPG